jgi:hypothetical protein
MWIGNDHRLATKYQFLEDELSPRKKQISAVPGPGGFGRQRLENGRGVGPMVFLERETVLTVAAADFQPLEKQKWSIREHQMSGGVDLRLWPEGIGGVGLGRI